MEELRIRIDLREDELLFSGETNSVGQFSGRAKLPFDAAETATIGKALDLSGNPAVTRWFDSDELNILRQWQVLALNDAELHPEAGRRYLELNGRALHRDALRRYVTRRLRDSLIEPLRVVFTKAMPIDRRALLPVRLELGETDVALFQLPWELLNADPLLNKQRVQFSRSIRFAGSVADLCPAPRVRLLVVQSEPEGLPQLNLKETTYIRDGLKGSRLAELFDIEAIDTTKGNYRTLVDCLNRGDDQPMVLHFAGHGDFGHRCENCGRLDTRAQPDRCRVCDSLFPPGSIPRGYLAFGATDADAARTQGNWVRWADSLELAQWLTRAPVQLVVLNCCKSAVGRRGDDIFNGMAQGLMASVADVPAIIATSSPVDNAAAEDFAELLYRNLGAGETLMGAMARVQEDLFGFRRDDWYRPILYLRSSQNDGGRLLRTEASPQPEPPEAPVAVPPRSAVPKLTYRRIAAALQSGSVVPILGPDALHGSSGVPPPASATGKLLPSGVDITQQLAKRSDIDAEIRSDLANESLEGAATYLELTLPRSRLIDLLYEYLGPDASEDAQIPEFYQMLPKTPQPILVITTNYDTLVEQAFRAAGKPYDLVTYPPDEKANANALLWWPHGESAPTISPANALDVDPKRVSVIFKMQGSLSEDELHKGVVVTELDYVKLLSKIGRSEVVPALLSKHCAENSLLYVGYRLDHWNYRSILLKLDEALRAKDSPDSWAVSPEFSTLERRFWLAREIQPIEADLSEFVGKLREHSRP